MVEPRIEDRDPQPLYFAALDGWRGLFVLLIVLGHSRLSSFVPGGLGVTALMVASGFTVTISLLSVPSTVEARYLQQYVRRRLVRLILPLVLYLSISAIFLWMVEGRANFGEFLIGAGPTGNYYKIFVGYERIGGAPSPAHVLWPLSILELWYLLVIPLAWLSRSARGPALILLTALCVVPLLARVALLMSDSEKWLELDYIYAASEMRIDSFAWGGLVAIAVSHSTSSMLGTKVSARWLVLVGFALMVVSLAIRRPEFRESIRYTTQSISLALLMYAPTLPGSHWWKSLLAWSSLVKVGKLAYPLFLYHWFAVVVATVWFGTGRGNLAWQLVYWPTAAAMAAASHFLLSGIAGRLGGEAKFPCRSSVDAGRLP
jgi:peptidoglycan/LPS O-acetylase OafA/YrhL